MYIPEAGGITPTLQRKRHLFNPPPYSSRHIPGELSFLKIQQLFILYLYSQDNGLMSMGPWVTVI